MTNAARDARGPRLLFVGTNRGPGGTESHLVSLAIGMANAGYDVSAVVRPDDVISRALAADGRITLFNAAFERTVDTKAIRSLVKACRVVRPHWLIGSYAREFWPLSTVARAQRIPLALFLHIQRISRLSAPFFPWLASRFILPSEYLRHWVVTRRWMPRWRTRVLFNPIDVERFRPDAARREAARRHFGFAPDDVVIGFAGRFERQKGVFVLASALEEIMTRLPNARALWVGGGEVAPEIQVMTAASPHAKRHVREPWSDDIVSCFAAMDVLAFPPIRRESFGRVSAEGQACGLPVVASRVGGTPETIRENVSGLLVPPGDVPALTDALTRLVTDAPLRARMGAAGRAQAVERFAASHIAAKFGQILGYGSGSTSA
ncbi:MAG TPA: glycosyltransferase family 4 protein [Gemmatimonadaceae bacterium]|nr:glycosyltransferase family 4 protein [Gemmatimonadaceae bacterium]